MAETVAEKASAMLHPKGTSVDEKHLKFAIRVQLSTTKETLRARKKALFYNVDTYNPKHNLRNLLRYRGTTFKLVFKGADFWLLMAWHIVCSVFYYAVYTKSPASTTTVRAEFPYVDHGFLSGAAGTLVVFVLAFYVNQTYERFCTVYNVLQAAFGALDRVVIYIRAKMYDGAFEGAAEARQDIFRFVLSAQYVALAHLPDYKAEGLDQWVWEHLVAEAYLTVEEAKDLSDIQAQSGYSAFKELIMWSLCRAHREVQLGNITSGDLQEWEHNSLMSLRMWNGDLYDLSELPIPFAYYHLVNFALLVYLFFLGYTFIKLSPYWSIAAYLLVLLAMLGLRELAMSLAEPFGTDEQDLPAMGWMLALEEKLASSMKRPPPHALHEALQEEPALSRHGRRTREGVMLR